MNKNYFSKFTKPTSELNPKTNLWNIMKNITNTYYYLDSFERIDMKMFVEDQSELTSIGNEMFDSFGLDTININFFVDVCAAPGMYSKIIFDKKDAKLTGIGISLPPEKGGVEFTFNNDNYKQFYKDILEKSYILELPKKLDFGIGSCVSYVDSKSKSHELNMELILTSINMIMNNLAKSGNMIINMSMKNIYACYNILFLLSKYFTEIKLWKSSNVWGTKNTFYVFCYNFRAIQYSNEIKNYIEDIKNSNSKINTTYIGDKDTFDTITSMMNPIYIVRINSWLKLAS
jgi:hypothetical protein